MLTEARVFQRSGAGFETSILNGEPFLYPQSHQYPFDPTCREIVTTLAEAGWSVPGIKVDFWRSPRESDGKPISVRTIEGENFRLTFTRNFRRIPNEDGSFSTEGAFTEVSSLVIPGRRLDVYDDFSGPSFYTYHGRNWKKDKGHFADLIEMRDLMGGRRRYYMSYTGSDDLDKYVGQTGITSQFLIPDKYDITAHRPYPWEPKYYVTAAVFGEYNEWLIQHVLNPLRNGNDSQSATASALHDDNSATSIVNLDMSELPSGEKPKGQGVIGYLPRSIMDVLLRRPWTPVVSHQRHIEAMTAGFLALLMDEALKNQTKGDQPVTPSEPISLPTSSSL